MVFVFIVVVKIKSVFTKTPLFIVSAVIFFLKIIFNINRCSWQLNLLILRKYKPVNRTMYTIPFIRWTCNVILETGLGLETSRGRLTCWWASRRTGGWANGLAGRESYMLEGVRASGERVGGADTRESRWTSRLFGLSAGGQGGSRKADGQTCVQMHAGGMLDGRAGGWLGG